MVARCLVLGWTDRALDKGKPAARQGRKADGPSGEVAGLPKGVMRCYEQHPVSQRMSQLSGAELVGLIFARCSLLSDSPWHWLRRSFSCARFDRRMARPRSRRDLFQLGLPAVSPPPPP